MLRRKPHLASVPHRAPAAARARIALVCLLLALWPWRPLSAQDAERVALVKAGFLIKFPEFVQWPQAASQGPVRVCVLGPSELTVPLRAVALHVRYRGEAPSVQELDRSGESTGCHLLFIAGERARELDRILSEVGGRPVLTVGDTPGFAQRGVHINLFTEGDRVRFEIDREAMEASSLTASFRLLEMARPISR